MALAQPPPRLVLNVGAGQRGHHHQGCRGVVPESERADGVDGLAGPAVWTTLLNDVAAQKVDPTPYVYVLVSKNLPETLTLYNNGGMAQYSNIPVEHRPSGGRTPSIGPIRCSST